jgi:radical SAM superfamily enzyme YgiQ (UPF0313 family)
MEPRPRSSRVALIRGPAVAPRGSLNNEPCPPIGLAYLAGALRAAGFPVQAIDASGEALDRVAPLPGTGLQHNGLGIDEIVARVPPSTRVIGLSTMFSHEWPHDRALARALRRAFPEALIVAGGEHATAVPDFVLRDCPELDACLLGEGEDLLVDYCARVEAGGPRETLRGTFRRQRVDDPAALAWPAWDLLPLEAYLSRGMSFGAGFGRNMPLLVSRGCPYECTFCSSPVMWTTKYRLRPVADVLDEVQGYVARYAITGLQLYDLTAVVQRRWIIDFCRGLVERRLELDWSLPSGTRSEALDEEVLGHLADSGCRYLVYAPESGSERTLSLIKKRVSLPRLTASVAGAVRRGIAVRVNLIAGFPHETRRDLFETLRLQARMAWLGVEDCPLYPFQPYPGSELFEGLLASGRVRLDDRYFETLASLSTGRFALPDDSYCERVGRLELHALRVAGFLLFYAAAYLLRPLRAARTLRNVLFGTRTSSVLEQRLKDRLRRLRVSLSASAP